MKPFLQGKKTLDVPALRLPPGFGPAPKSVGTGARPAQHTAACESPGPVVETIKEGDKVVRLIITCTCGERIEIDCLYPAGH